jgi:broad specificity phosphatase PhoE
MKIYFARHAESQANRLHVISNRQIPHGLTDAGRSQAARLAERLENSSIERIFSSPLLRAVQTASLIAEHLHVSWEPADGLREFDCGIAEGRSDGVAWGLWQAEYEAWVFNHDYAFQIEGGESFYEVRQRFEKCINTLLSIDGAPNTNLLCISHGGIYSLMFPLIMANVTPDMIKKLGFDYTSCIVALKRAHDLVCVEWNGVKVQYSDP